MSTARVFGYLTVRVFFNSIRRAFSNPLRALLTLMIAAFVVCGWGMALIVSLMEGARPRGTMMDPSTLLERSAGVVVLIHWFYVVSVLLPVFARANTTLFRESDVDFLFATPLRPLAVFRGILWARGLLTAFFLLFVLVVYLLLFGGRNVQGLLVGVEPVVSVWAIGVYPILYLLVFSSALIGRMAIALLEMVGYRLRGYLLGGAIAWAVLCVVVVGVPLLQGIREGERPFLALNDALNWLPAKVLMFPVQGLADSALVLYQGWTPAIWLNLVLWGGVLILADRVLVRYQDRLYELASQLARLGGQVQTARANPIQAYYDRLLERAERRTLRTPRLLERWTTRGVWALLWRDLILFWRANGIGSLLIMLVLALVPVGVAYAFWATVGAERDLNRMAVALQVMYLGIHATVIFLYSLGGYYAYAHMLRRADLQKPFPFSPYAVVVVEVLPTVVLYALCLLVSTLLMIVLFPWGALVWLAGWLGLVSWTVVLQMVMFTLALINPDPTDYTQRLLVGVLMFPFLCVGGIPGIILWILGVALKLPILIVGLLVVVLNTVLSAIVVAINGALYEQFSPVD